MISHIYSKMCNCIDLINHLFNPRIEFLNEVKIDIKIHQLSKNLGVRTCVAFVFKEFPFVVRLCRKGFLRSR